MIGTTLSHFKITAKLGREVAIKVLPAALTADPERRLRFEREAQAAAALDHPNIAVIHEVGEAEGHPLAPHPYRSPRVRTERCPLGRVLRCRDAVGRRRADSGRSGIFPRLEDLAGRQ